MENARMNYYFTGIIILMLTALAFCVKPVGDSTLKIESKEYIVPPPKPKDE